MTEHALSKAVVGLAERLGWRVFTQRFSHKAGLRSHGSLGFPDIVALKGTRMLVVELKGERGALRPGQEEWLEAFAAAGAETHVWRPADWTNGTVEHVLLGRQRCLTSG